MACWSGWSEFHPDEDRLFNSPTREALAHGRLFLPKQVAFANRNLGLPLEALRYDVSPPMLEQRLVRW